MAGFAQQATTASAKSRIFVFVVIGIFKKFDRRVK